MTNAELASLVRVAGGYLAGRQGISPVGAAVVVLLASTVLPVLASGFLPANAAVQRPPDLARVALEAAAGAVVGRQTRHP